MSSSTKPENQNNNDDDDMNLISTTTSSTKNNQQQHYEIEMKSKTEIETVAKTEQHQKDHPHHSFLETIIDSVAENNDSFATGVPASPLTTIKLKESFQQQEEEQTNIKSTRTAEESADDGDNESTTTTAAADKIHEQQREQQCWRTFLISCSIAAIVLILIVRNEWDALSGNGQPVQLYSFAYFTLCAIGGMISTGIPHIVLTPIDHTKVRMQTGEFKGSAYAALFVIWKKGSRIHHQNDDAKEDDDKSVWSKIVVLWRGWFPSSLGHFSHGGIKFCMFELLKWYLPKRFGGDSVSSVFVYLIAAGIAEICANTQLAPWEAVKIRIQGNPTFPDSIREVMPRMWFVEGFRGFYKGLPALWARQIPLTMTKFCTFQLIVQFFYDYILRTSNKGDVGHGTQLIVSCLSGFFSGFACAVVSHPSDTIISRINQKATDSKTGGTWDIVKELGFFGLWSGILPRILWLGMITSIQFLIYDSFKVLVGLPTTGGH